MIDAGCETYTAKTFSSHKYEIWTMQSNYHNLPMINGIPQQYGAKYRAENVSFNPKNMLFTADIAHAYPMEAQVSRWIRSYKLEQNAVIIKDDFKLDGNGNPNRINFLTWGKVDVSVPGVVTIEVNEEKALMTYDKNSFTASIETINLDDSKLSDVWGNRIYRVSLNAKKRLLSGTYLYKITKL